jgi:hypothetical protein
VDDLLDLPIRKLVDDTLLVDDEYAPPEEEEEYVLGGGGLVTKEVDVFLCDMVNILSLLIRFCRIISSSSSFNWCFVMRLLTDRTAAVM